MSLSEKDELEYWMSEHLRLNGVYWGLTALALMKSETALNRDDLIAYVLSCQTPEGSFGGHVSYDGHLLYTLSAVQILVVACMFTLRLLYLTVWKDVKSLQNPDGSFCGDKWGEVDTRFSYCALSSVEFVDQCKNFDGGYGSIPGAESHAAYVFCCVGALAFADALHLVDADKLGWWLAERQLDSGGLNGRPRNLLMFVCYSWIHWIDGDKLASFILQSQDEDGGGIADRPGDAPDVFHTFSELLVDFGFYPGLSLLGYSSMEKVDPRYCMPVSVIDRLGLPKHSFH
ncbi:terpenoid cyclases/protein prenyltransferase alpha-alpha toroid [Chytridium lagenaria]|nr:terpenoid cyclases/protein prenyltransferase alpha-alpha toroid [Chytridium lagenaria]